MMIIRSTLLNMRIQSSPFSITKTQVLIQSIYFRNIDAKDECNPPYIFKTQ